MYTRIRGILMLVAFLSVALISTGCGQTGKQEAKGKNEHAHDHKHGEKAHGKEVAANDTKHSGWWCQEHGVPEHLCSLCSEKVEEQCKKDGDWCKIHDRAQSQCFKCDPSKYQKFEAMYEAKYGKAPKRPPASEFEK